MTTLTGEEIGSPAWELSEDQRGIQIASLRHSCSLHALDITGICLALNLAYASCPVPKTSYIRHEDSQCYNPECTLLTEVRSNIVGCYNMLQCMSNAGHD